MDQCTRLYRTSSILLRLLPCGLWATEGRCWASGGLLLGRKSHPGRCRTWPSPRGHRPIRRRAGGSYVPHRDTPFPTTSYMPVSGAREKDDARWRVTSRRSLERSLRQRKRQSPPERSCPCPLPCPVVYYQLLPSLACLPGCKYFISILHPPRYRYEQVSIGRGQGGSRTTIYVLNPRQQS